MIPYLFIASSIFWEHFCILPLFKSLLHISNNLSLRSKFNSYFFFSPISNLMMLNKVETCGMQINKRRWLDQVSVTSQRPLNLFISSLQTNPDICNWYLTCFMTCNYQITIDCIQSRIKTADSRNDWVCLHPCWRITQRAGQEKITRPDLTCWNFAHDMV